jgi:hypothetical protein
MKHIMFKKNVNPELKYKNINGKIGVTECKTAIYEYKLVSDKKARH